MLIFSALVCAPARGSENNKLRKLYEITIYHYNGVAVECAYKARTYESRVRWKRVNGLGWTQGFGQIVVRLVENCKESETRR